MPSLAVVAKRKFNVSERIEAVVANLSGLYSVERVGGKKLRIRDKEFAYVVKMEEFADFLEALQEKLTVSPIEAGGNFLTPEEVESSTPKRRGRTEKAVEADTEATTTEGE
jgi:hypothetical protein